LKNSNSEGKISEVVEGRRGDMELGTIIIILIGLLLFSYLFVVFFNSLKASWQKGAVIGLVYGALTVLVWGIAWGPSFRIPFKSCRDLDCTVEFIAFFPPSISSQLFRGDAVIISSLFIGAVLGGFIAHLIAKRVIPKSVAMD
jgi:hypothetical protein